MNLGKLFAGWGFRTSTPTYAAGDALEAFVTGNDPAGGVRVRIGDTVLRLPDADPDLVDARIRLEVTSFDADAHEGTAKLVEVVRPPE
jgi:hypothetical protein